MTLRTRVTLAAGFAVLLAVVAMSVVVYLVERGNLRAEIDASLHHIAAQPHVLSGPPPAEMRDLPLVRDVYIQVVSRDGSVGSAFAGRRLPVTAEVLAAVRGGRERLFDLETGTGPVRVLVNPAGDGTALQVGRSLGEVDRTLNRLVAALLVITVVAVGLAAMLGRIVATAAVLPVRRVAEAAQTVARTRDLSHHIAEPGGDDLGRLAESFNTMLDALGESLALQRRLVADASHELRTPLATVRTNVEVLARADELDPEDRDSLITDTVAQIGELTRLVGDLVELARGEGEEEPFTEVDLDVLTREVVTAARRDHPELDLRVDAEASRIHGAPARLARAIANLVDNAAKWSPPDAPVEVAVRNGMVIVRDHGPGVDAADLPHIFERFYRSPRARSMPGSGLGLAIAKQVADHHHGTITAAAAPGGGALFVLRLPLPPNT